MRYLLILCALASALPAQKRMLKLDDLARFREVRSPQLSSDGKWVAYTVSAIDVKEDKTITHIWVASYDGKTQRQMTNGPDSESSPQ